MIINCHDDNHDQNNDINITDEFSNVQHLAEKV